MKRIGMIFLAMLVAVTFLAAGCIESPPPPDTPPATTPPAQVSEPISDDPVGDTHKAGVAVECGHYDIAIQLLDAVLRTPGVNDKTMAIAYNYRGLANTWLGNCDAAIANYTSAIETWPGYDAAYYNRGFTYAKCGNVAAGQADMAKANGMGYYPQNRGRKWCPAF